MKTQLGNLSFILGICITTLISCKPDPVTLPVVSTIAVTAITGATAVSGGTVTDNGGATVTARGICWGTRTNPTLDDSISNDGQGVGNFETKINNLLPNTNYFVRAYATNSVGTAYGKTISFKTINLPLVNTVSSMSNITGTTAVCGGNVMDEGGQPVISKGVCWSINTIPTINDNKTTDGTGSGSFVSNITGLTPYTTYFVCAYATSAVGTAYGKVIGFTTGKLPKVSSNLSFIKITTTSFVCGGSVTSDGGEPVTAKGICWSTNSGPTINDNKTNDGMLIGDFNSSATGLTLNTTYHVRAYATSAFGTAYGEEGVVKTLDVSQIVTDIDGNTYHTIPIGTQTWLVENLKTTKYQNGEAIPTTSTSTQNISTETNPKYQWPYSGVDYYLANYGRLYTWYAATDSRNIAPAGWRVATEADWNLLENYVNACGYNNGGVIIYTIANTLAAKTAWASSSINGTVGYYLIGNNSSGFTAMPGGVRGDASFSGLLTEGYWWTAAENNSTNYNVRYLMNTSSVLSKSTFNKYYGLSIKCVKN